MAEKTRLQFFSILLFKVSGNEILSIITFLWHKQQNKQQSKNKYSFKKLKNLNINFQSSISDNWSELCDWFFNFGTFQKLKRFSYHLNYCLIANSISLDKLQEMKSHCQKLIRKLINSEWMQITNQKKTYIWYKLDHFPRILEWRLTFRSFISFDLLWTFHIFFTVSC